MNKTLFGILCIFFNQLGVPCFLQGYAKAGILRIVFGIVTCGVISIINSIMGIILAIKVFKMTEEEFQAQYGTLDYGIIKMIPEEK